MKNVLKPLAKSVLVPLGLKAVASATNGAIHKRMLELGCRASDLALRATALIISNEEMNDVMKIVKSL